MSLRQISSIASRGFLGLCMLSLGLAVAGPAQTVPAQKDNPAAIFRLGQQALAAGDLDSAESSFRKVLRINPSSAAAHANLGVVAMRRKNWEQALLELHKAEKLDPKMAGVRLNIGLVEYHRANYEQAISPLASVIRDDPGSLQARYLLGLCYSFLERPADAVATLEPLWPQMSDQFVYLYV